MKKIIISFIIGAFALVNLLSQSFVTNYDEESVPVYRLPDPLLFEDGSKVSRLSDWDERRLEILELFRNEVYGNSPAWTGEISVSEVFRDDESLDGLAIMRDLKLTLTNGDRSMDINVLMHLPKLDKPIPIFLGLNFFGNQTTTANEHVRISSNWTRDNEAFGITDNRATEASRGVRVARWPASELVARGYGLLTVYCGDIDPDFDHGFTKGVHALMGMDRDSTSWGTVAAWAWGLSRVLDYLETDPMIDHNRVAVMGHSRLGKAALWAGATDPRFAMVISNNSGCGGAALSKRQFGETVYAINSKFPHWFNDRFKLFNKQEDLLPVDQHQLIALIAPRPVYVASAAYDRWADPKGEFLSVQAASAVYAFLGIGGLPADSMPQVNHPVMGALGYHIRPGGHDVTLYDWMSFADFADKHWKQ